MTHSTARVLFLSAISAFVTWGRSLPPATVPLLDRQNAIPIMRTSLVSPLPPITEDGRLSRIG